MANTTERAIILDCDPGIDDAVAIAVLLRARRERVRLVFTTYGNIPLEKTTRNALSLLALLGAADIPVARGAAQPGPGNAAYEDASYIHGGDGIGGLQSSELFQSLQVKEPLEGDALRIVYDAIVEAGSADYITLGPMTNLSALIKRFPDVVGRLNQVVTMGGGIGLGNVTEFAEFNFYCDAESAQHVLSTVPSLVLAPIDITTQVNFSMEQIAAIGAAGTPAAQAMEAMLTLNYKQCVAYGEPGATMHDSTAVLAYLYPELFEFKACGIRMECGKERYGESTVAEGSNVQLMVKTEPARLLELIAESLK